MFSPEIFEKKKKGSLLVMQLVTFRTSIVPMLSKENFKCVTSTFATMSCKSVAKIYAYTGIIKGAKLF